MAKIEDHRYTIEEAFQECFYIVPDYQREYVWTEKEVQQLLQDVDDEAGGGNHREYFIGTVLVSPVAQKNHFEVIDGQQRLTTFFLLICALRQRFAGEQENQHFANLLATSYTHTSGKLQTSLKLEPRYEHAGELMNHIVVISADPQTTRAKVAAAGIPKFGSLENLLAAYDVIHKFLDINYSDLDALRKFWAYLANNVVFIQISTDVSSALKIFETINERGIGLNPMDLLKNLLFTQVEPGQFTRLKNEWKKVTAPLEKSKERPLRFLRYFIMANYKVKNSRSDGVVREDEIYSWLTDKDNAALCGYRDDPFEFVRKVVQNVDRYIAFTKGQRNDSAASLAMETLQQLCGPAFSLHYVLLLAAAELPGELFDYFVRQLESFLFYYIFTKTSTRDLERNFSIWADELREMGGIADPQAQKQRLNTFVADRFQVSINAKAPELRDALRRYAVGSMQQYRTRYLLSKLTQHVEMAFKGMSVPGSLREFTVLEMEHILPERPQPELRASFSAASSGKNYDDYVARLGNLTLLEKPINIVASNGFFEEKKAKYASSGNYLTRSIGGLAEVGKNTSIERINAKLLAPKAWTADDIERRQEMLIGLAKDIWQTAPTAM